MSIVIITLLVHLSFAHDARRRKKEIIKKEQSAIVADYDLPKETVADALENQLEKAGLGQKKIKKGFMVYKGTVWTEISVDKLDVYAKVDGNNLKSSVTMVVSKGPDKNCLVPDTEKVRRVQDFLNNFTTEAKMFQLNRRIQTQASVITKAERDFKTASDEELRLAHEKENVERQIADNQRELTRRYSTLKALRQELKNIKEAPSIA